MFIRLEPIRHKFITPPPPTRRCKHCGRLVQGYEVLCPLCRKKITTAPGFRLIKQIKGGTK